MSNTHRKISRALGNALRVCVTLLLLGGLAFGQALPTASPGSVGLSVERLGLIRTVLQKEIDADRLPGAVVMIARKGKLVYYEAIGFKDKAAGMPMTRDAIFRIYSMTKPLVSVVAMMMVEEGKIQLTDPVSKFFPAFSEMKVLVTDKDGNVATEPAKRPITVYDLLRHTAGLDYGEFTTIPQIKAAYAEAGLFQPNGAVGDSRMITAEQEVAGFARAPLVSQPGTNWKYSMAVDLLGRVLEAASGKRLSDLLEERLFKPMNMVDTGFWVPPAKWTRIAEPLAKDTSTGKPTDPMLDVKIVPVNDSGGAGGVSTAMDYLRFCQMLLAGGALDGKRCLSPTTIKLMTSDHLGNRTTLPLSPGEVLMGVQGYTFGLGFMVRQGPGIAAVSGSEGEFMWGGVAGTFFWIDPKEKLAVVLMAQVPGSVRQYYRRMLKQLVAQAIVE
jgi:CubicO group peptidase (beta-lactamase class C family)